MFFAVFCSDWKQHACRYPVIPLQRIDVRI